MFLTTAAYDTVDSWFDFIQFSICHWIDSSRPIPMSLSMYPTIPLVMMMVKIKTWVEKLMVL